MEQTECSETSAYKIQTPGNYPEENTQQSKIMYTGNDCVDVCALWTASVSTAVFNRISCLTLKEAKKNNLKQDHFTWSFCNLVLLQPSLSICSVCIASQSPSFPLTTTLHCCSHFGPRLGRLCLLGCFPFDFFSKTIFLLKYIHTTLFL